MELKSCRRKICGMYGRSVDVDMSQIMLIFWSIVMLLSSKDDVLCLRRSCSSESEFCACCISSNDIIVGIVISLMRDKASATMLSGPVRWTMFVENSAINER